MQHRVCSNDDPGLTLTYFTARSNLVPYAFVWEKGKTTDFSETIIVLWFETSNRWPKWQEVSADIKTLSPALGLYTYIKSWKKNVENQTSKRFFLNLQQMSKVIKSFCWHKNFVPWGLSAPALGLYTCIKSCFFFVQNQNFKRFFLNLQQMNEVTRCFC